MIGIIQPLHVDPSILNGIDGFRQLRGEIQESMRKCSEDTKDCMDTLALQAVKKCRGVIYQWIYISDRDDRVRELSDDFIRSKKRGNKRISVCFFRTVSEITP